MVKIIFELADGTGIRYKPRNLRPNFMFIVHKLSVISTALDYKPHWKNGVKNIQAASYNGACTVNGKEY